MTFQPQKLTHADINAAADKINVPVAALKAVIAVECRGSGFKGDRPIILFERHVFYRNLSSRNRDVAVMKGLATKRWKRGYLKTQSARYGRLNKAIKIDNDAALKACSWGLGQVLGENWRFCNFSNISEFVEYQFESEANQLDTMCRYIVAAKLDDDLRAFDWAGFALGYNGRGYEKNKYHKKLARAYKKAGGTGKINGTRAQYSLRHGARGARVKALQKQLKAIGFNIKIDGVFGSNTRLCVRSFQEHRGLKVDGLVGKKTKDAIELALSK
ncbi:MAG: DUF3380 domain-containing protein [Rhizobiales bacterium]|nr:DUF3380 domain-containing protein [Hyphomicrobiales bacterium]